MPMELLLLLKEVQNRKSGVLTVVVVTLLDFVIINVVATIVVTVIFQVAMVVAITTIIVA